jgi:hypothetical protein
MAPKTSVTPNAHVHSALGVTVTLFFSDTSTAITLKAPLGGEPSALLLILLVNYGYLETHGGNKNRTYSKRGYFLWS